MHFVTAAGGAELRRALTLLPAAGQWWGTRKRPARGARRAPRPGSAGAAAGTTGLNGWTGHLQGARGGRRPPGGARNPQRGRRFARRGTTVVNWQACPDHEPSVVSPRGPAGDHRAAQQSTHQDRERALSAGTPWLPPQRATRAQIAHWSATLVPRAAAKRRAAEAAARTRHSGTRRSPRWPAGRPRTHPGGLRPAHDISVAPDATHPLGIGDPEHREHPGSRAASRTRPSGRRRRRSTNRCTARRTRPPASGRWPRRH
ncbi:hypothetical protein QJS66_22490 [Kocuria rhizophila]|nr:hypothetical protein QJS66_22490 [Kocuria rhizophila]